MNGEKKWYGGEMTRPIRSAFTILEISIGVAISLLLVTGMFRFLSFSIKTTVTNQVRLDEIEQIRNSLRDIQKDLSQIREWDSEGDSAVVSEKVSFKKIAKGEITFINNFGQQVTFKEVVKGGKKVFTRKVKMASILDLSFVDQIRAKVKDLGGDLKMFTQKTTDQVKSLATNKIAQVVGGDGDMLKTVISKVKITGEDAKFIANQAMTGSFDPGAILEKKVTDAVKDLKYFVNGDKGASEGSFVHDIADIVKGNADQVAAKIMDIRTTAEQGVDGVKADVNNLVNADKIGEHVIGVLMDKFFEKLDKEMHTTGEGERTTERDFKIDFQVVMKQGQDNKIVDLTSLSDSGLDKEELKKVFGFKVAVPLDNFKKKIDDQLARAAALPEKMALNIFPKGLKKAFYNDLDKWKRNPIASIRTGLTTLVQNSLAQSEYKGLIPEVKGLFRDGVEFPDLWVLDMFNTPELAKKLKQGLNFSDFNN